MEFELVTLLAVFQGRHWEKIWGIKWDGTTNNRHHESTWDSYINHDIDPSHYSNHYMCISSIR